MSDRPPQLVLTLGEALVALLPTKPVGLAEARCLVPMVGGAELNFAIGLARLGVPTAWVGHVGDDPFGLMVLQTLAHEGVTTRWTTVERDRATGVYFREWLPDGVRRPYYYRQGSAAERLSPSDLPSQDDVDPRWLHITGITPALGPAPAAAVTSAVEHAVARGVPISLDPNYRESLWSPAEARAALMPLVRQASVLLMSRHEAALLFDAQTPRQALATAHRQGAETVVVKLAGDGAVASRAGGKPQHARAAAVMSAPDPVGAGDGFDAGFITARLAGADLEAALRVGNHIGARAVQVVGEHGYPRMDELPHELAAVIGRPALASSRSNVGRAGG